MSVEANKELVTRFYEAMRFNKRSSHLDTHDILRQLGINA